MLSRVRQLIRPYYRAAGQATSALRGFTTWTTPFPPSAKRELGKDENPLRTHFEAKTTGPGIWKWNHYFDAYNRHFARFRNREVHVLEIGVYSGGSLPMWREYFGPGCHVYGVDIEEACRAYESESVRIFIGDQADRCFWERVRREIPVLDIVIDDGGHLPHQQIVTVEELLPHISPGGVYVCEDIHGDFNQFGSYLGGFARHLNSFRHIEHNPPLPERRIVCPTNAVQSAVSSIHLYPFMAVIERNSSAVPELVAPKHGTEWEPFLS